MKEITLEAEPRSLSTKGDVKLLRQKGRVPAVAYGDNEKPVTLSVDEKQVQVILHSEGGHNALINLNVGGKAHAVLIKEIQRHPITRALRHVDFHRISLKKKIETGVPVHVKGDAPGVKIGGGVLEHVVREVKIRCLPTEIPTAIDVDVTSLQLNQSIKVKDLRLPAGVELLTDADSVVVHVVAVVVEETPVAAAAVPGATPAEPEVIKKGKVEEGAEGATAAAGDKKAAAPAAGAKPEAKKPEGK